MSGGGGGFKKLLINFIVDKPAQAYLSGGALLFMINRTRAQSNYAYYFGKFEFERRVERNML